MLELPLNVLSLLELVKFDIIKSGRTAASKNN